MSIQLYIMSKRSGLSNILKASEKTKTYNTYVGVLYVYIVLCTCVKVVVIRLCCVKENGYGVFPTGEMLL